MKQNNTSLEGSIVPWHGKTIKLIDNSIEDILTENNIDLTLIQFIVLKNLHLNEGISQKDLAFFTNRNKSSLARMIATLERKNYIHKEVCDQDKRKSKLKISEKGQAVLIDSAPFFDSFVRKIETDINEEEKQILIKVLNKIQNNIIGEVPSPFFKERK